MEPIREAMYVKIVKGDWDYHWSHYECQRFVTTGRTAFTFCGKETNGGHLCNDCLRLKIGNHLYERFRGSDLTPREYYEQKRDQSIAQARSRLPEGV